MAVIVQRHHHLPGSLVTVTIADGPGGVLLVDTDTNSRPRAHSRPHGQFSWATARQCDDPPPAELLGRQHRQQAHRAVAHDCDWPERPGTPDREATTLAPVRRQWRTQPAPSASITASTIRKSDAEHGEPVGDDHLGTSHGSTDDFRSAGSPEARCASPGVGGYLVMVTISAASGLVVAVVDTNSRPRAHSRVLGSFSSATVLTLTLGR